MTKKERAEACVARLEEKYALEKAAASAPEPDMESRVQLGRQLQETLKIGIEDFAQVDLRVAKVVECQPVKRAKKLLRLSLDDGTANLRTVASGIAQWYKPEDLVGHNVILVSNLRPAVLCGVESQGMILAADAGEGVKVIFADGIPAGSKVR